MKIAFDVTLMQPGCVLLQAALGGSSSIAHRFPVGSWLLAPTPGMKIYEINDEQLKILVKKVEEVHEGLR